MSNLSAKSQMDSVRYVVPSMKENWFVSVGGSMNFFSSALRDYHQLNGPTEGFELAVGKWFTPYWGIRLQYDWSRAKSYTDYLSNRYKVGEPVAESDEKGNPAVYKSEFYYRNLHLDVLCNPLDMINGFWKDNRIYTPILFAGMGLSASSEKQLIFSSDSQNFEYSLDLGLLNEFKVVDHWTLFLEGKFSMMRWSLDSHSNTYRGHRLYNCMLTVSAGVTYNIGRAFDREGRAFVEPIRSDRVAGMLSDLNMQIADQDAKLAGSLNEIEMLQKKLAEMSKPQTKDTVVRVTDIFDAPFSFFFALDSYELSSEGDFINLEALAKAAVKGNVTLKVYGFADEATGNSTYNQLLSEKRAEVIAAQLEKFGLPREKMIMEGFGGVANTSPFPLNRRVIVSAAK